MSLSTHIRFCLGHVEVPKSSFRYILDSMPNLWGYSQTDQTLIRKHTNCLFFYCSYFYNINGENLSYPLFLNSYNCKLWYILFRPSLFFSIEIGDL